MSTSGFKLVIVIGTLSPLKLKAIKGAFRQAKNEIARILSVAELEFVFVPTAPKSDVNEQPVGWDETIRGANNRANNALILAKLEAEPRFVIAIENGVVDVPTNGKQHYMDVAWVVLNDRNTGKQYASSSTSLSVPYDIIEKTKAIGFETTTIGDVMHQTDPSISKKDPHSSLLGGVLTRIPLMQQAVLSCIGQWIYAVSTEKAQ